MAVAKDSDTIVELTDEAAHDLFDRQAKRYLNMSGADFLRAWHAGKFAGREDEPAVVHVVKLLPLVEASPERGRE